MTTAAVIGLILGGMALGALAVFVMFLAAFARSWR